MNAIPNIKEAKSYENQSHALRRRPPKRIGFFPIPECTRLSIRQAVDRLLEKAHELADRADAKKEICLRRAADKAIEQVHEVANVLESLEDQLTEAG